MGVLLLLLPPPIHRCASIPMAMLMLPTNGRVVCGALYIIQRSRNPHRVSLQSMPGQSPNPPLSPWWMERNMDVLGRGSGHAPTYDNCYVGMSCCHVKSSCRFKAVCQILLFLISSHRRGGSQGGLSSFPTCLSVCPPPPPTPHYVFTPSLANLHSIRIS